MLKLQIGPRVTLCYAWTGCLLLSSFSEILTWFLDLSVIFTSCAATKPPTIAGDHKRSVRCGDLFSSMWPLEGIASFI